MDLKSKIRVIEDFPKKGISCKDITTLTKDGEAFQEAINMIIDEVKDLEFDYIAGVEARGFILAAPMAMKLGKGFIPVRKPGKLPGEILRKEYSLEYGTNAVELSADAVKKGDKVLLVDDLLATGGTAKAALDLLEEAGAEIAAVGFLIELEELNGMELFKENKKNKIDNYKYLLKDLDSDLLSLIKERIALSEEYNSYIFKNNLENKKKLINSFSEVNLKQEDYELKEIFKLLDNMSNKSYRNLSKKYKSNYAYISDKKDDFLEFIFYQILGQKIEQFDVDDFNELSSILNRDNFKGYILKDSCGYKLIDHLTDSTDQTKEIGQINLVQKFNKKNYGFNTEYVGLLKFLQKEAIDLKAKTVAVLYKDEVNKSIDYALNKYGVEKRDHIDINDFKGYQVYYKQVLISTVDLG